MLLSSEFFFGLATTLLVIDFFYSTVEKSPKGEVFSILVAGVIALIGMKFGKDGQGVQSIAKGAVFGLVLIFTAILLNKIV